VRIEVNEKKLPKMRYSPIEHISFVRITAENPKAGDYQSGSSLAADVTSMSRNRLL